MRLPIPIALLLVLLAGSCGGDEEPGAGRIPVEVAATAGADSIAIERAVAGFLQGYATADVGTELLEQHVAGPDLEDWVHWLAVQYRGVEGRISADLEVAGIRTVQIEGQAAAAGVQAAVAITSPGRDGQPAINVRRFQSPFLLVRGDEPLEWRVVDVNRDGRSMRDAITVLEGVGAEAAGLQVEVASVYRFASGTVVNVRIKNGRDVAVTVDGRHSVLQVGGRFLGSSLITSSLARPIPPDSTAEGAFNFPPIPLTSVPELLRLFILEEDGEPEVVVNLPFEQFPPRDAA
ncbi:MAG TPA: hypothetical protein VEA19_04035 [Actinomycetota bacterium]|nr:hypothetical protein [Actinomycetota bacterium]